MRFLCLVVIVMGVSTDPVPPSRVGDVCLNPDDTVNLLQHNAHVAQRADEARVLDGTSGEATRDAKDARLRDVKGTGDKAVVAGSEADNRGIQKSKLPKVKMDCRERYERLGETKLKTNCPKEMWVDAMVRADPAPGKVILNVGCNKGQDLFQWLGRWDLSRDGSQDWKTWVQGVESELALRGVTLNKRTGFHCGLERNESVMAKDLPDAVEDRDAKTSKSVRSIGVCAEAMPKNVELLGAVAAKNFPELVGSGTWLLKHTALVGPEFAKSTVDFPDGLIGEEALFVGRKGSLPTVAVPATTVDKLVGELQLGAGPAFGRKVDILLVDTNGFDPDVLRGSAEVLKTARYVSFEVARILKQTPWANTTLRSVVQQTMREFDCYWAGNNGKLLPVRDDEEEGDCIFENTGWSNVVCAKQGDVWAEVLREFVLPPNRH